ncbi:MAG: CSLREA domain-containing protein [Actinomycetota bacterium]|nr:CSLREA domain-containing protein [Actinomycetota bacterium]
MIYRQRWPQAGSLVRQVVLALAVATLMSILLLFPSRPASARTLPKADYQFQNTRSTSVGSAPPLIDIGPNTNTFTPATVDGTSRKVLSFPKDNGVKLSPTSDVVSNRTYTIVALFEFNTVEGYRRIIDFKNATSDNGLYVHNSKLEFYRGSSVSPAGGPNAPTSIAPNTYVQVVITRNSGGTVAGYVNGVQQFSFTDSSNDAVIGGEDVLRFFRDNQSDGVTTEHSAGSVARIRLYDAALDAAEVAALDRLPSTFTVNSTGDERDFNPEDGRCFTGTTRSGGVEACTLRAAIEQANATSGADTIDFGIITTQDGGCNISGVCSITPASDLPHITEAVTIDGYTQFGASENDLAKGSNADLRIELNGAASARVDTSGALFISTSDVTVRGLVINGWANRSGVWIDGRDTDQGPVTTERNKIQGNFIGTDPSGTQDLGNGIDGVSVFEARDTIVGGTTRAARNVISGNTGDGVRIAEGSTRNDVQGNLIGVTASGTGALGNDRLGVDIERAFNNTVGGTTVAARNVISANGVGGVMIGGDDGSRSGNNKVQGNFIGTTVSGVDPLGNRSDGVSVVDASDNTVGGAASAGNVIAFNKDIGVGVYVVDLQANDNRILSNSIHSNADLGIDLVSGIPGASPNDLKDLDSGPNGFQNSPVLSSATTTRSSITVEGSLNSTPEKTFTIQFFSNPTGNEGKTFLAQRNVTTNANGNASFTFSFNAAVPTGQKITATATGAEGTSEFSAPKGAT